MRITPLGGLGDVGRNSASFEINDELMILDCGVLFPDENHPGVDLILPGLHLLDDRLADILGALRAPDLRDDQHLIVSLLRMPRTVVAILGENGSPVEFDQPLFVIA